jgi:uncharacterized protein YjhX (UPF0386 family)
MPEIKNLFTSGKMNKDLDERLIPNNQYRDALNIQVASSEGSDVGAIENILGNTAIFNRSYNPSLNTYTLWGLNDSDTNYYGFDNAITIGVIKYDKEEKIYWFITGDNQDGILELDQTTNVISPILIDKNNVLNFSKNNLITGINIIDGLLFFTDDLNEPKSINIKKFKDATALSGDTSHTEIYGRDFIEDDVVVIKKSPLTAPSVEVKDSKREGNGTGINSISQSFNFAVEVDGGPDFESRPAGYEFNGSYYVKPNWKVGDVITWTNNFVDEDGNSEELIVSTVILSLGTGSGAIIPRFKILSIPDNVPNEYLTWDTVLKEGEPIFENSFGRFAYRWRYEDNQYSTFSPFSTVAFFPGKFRYLSTDGFNEGMKNNMRFLRVHNLESPPLGVKEIEVLYKDSVSTNIYTVDTLPLDNREIEIESELIHKVVESNQILRPWDNVPRLAKSQEIIGNRIVYGNYLQNYNVADNLSASFYLDSKAHSDRGLAKPSVKSLRTYQLGIVWKDKYGRETPIFTTKDSTLKIGSKEADKENKLTASINSEPPSWATHFKYFIKETSNQYYNLALDRFYFAEDGNIWLSFPSSERNKVYEETYMYLKKKHDSEDMPDEVIKYKILDISNEAPDFIAKKRNAVARTDCTIGTGDQPVTDAISFAFTASIEKNPEFVKEFKAPNYLKIVENIENDSNGGQRTLMYKIESGGLTSSNKFKVTLETPLKEDADFLSGIETGQNQIEIIVYKDEIEKNEEFEGRFFVKINRDSNIKTNIIDVFSGVEKQVIIESSNAIPYRIDRRAGERKKSTKNGPGWRDTKAEFTVWFDRNFRFTKGPPTAGSDRFQIGYSAGTAFSNGHYVNKTMPLLDDNLNKVGTLLRFVNVTTNQKSEIYTIKDFIQSRERRFDRRQKTKKAGNWRKQMEIILDRPFERGLEIGQDTNTSDRIEIVKEVFTDSFQLLASSNPSVFETEPKEAVDIDIYYEASDAFPVSEAATPKILNWFNCYSFGNGVESNRINDDFNAPTIDKGVKVSTVLDEPYEEERRASGLIFSQIFNSTSGVNNLNQFIQGLPITKDLNPAYGSIQKLHARDTDLITLCEDKCLKVLAQKDALFNADGNANITANNNVLGQTIPYVGEYGISKNPESFASYGFRAFFTDKNRGVVLRLSRNGLEEISAQGMRDYFKDKLSTATNVIGNYDDNSNCYNLSFNDDTVSYMQGLEGWPTRKSFIAEAGVSLNNKYYTFKNGVIWSHGNETRNNFYGVQYKSTVKLVLNANPSNVKSFKTIKYEGSSEWVAPKIKTNLQEGKVLEFKDKEGMYYNFIKGNHEDWNQQLQTGGFDSKEFLTQGIGTLGSISGSTDITQFTLTIQEDGE